MANLKSVQSKLIEIFNMIRHINKLSNKLGSYYIKSTGLD
jgi:hypothetical protein